MDFPTASARLWQNTGIDRCLGCKPMSQDSEQDLSKEERILRMMKRVLTDVAKDTHTTPGLKHALSDHTIQGIRECLALIVAREQELAEAAGRSMNMRPRYVDEPKTNVSVKLDVDAMKQGLKKDR